MNEDAIVVCEYLFETIRRQGWDAVKDFAFAQLVMGVFRAYRKEYDHVALTFKWEE